jgi:cytochrome o ubiquinol oxidase operon protein cyoD
MRAATDFAASSLRHYLTGFALAVLLTAISFAVVTAGHFSRSSTLMVIAIAAVLQILVHLRYFLHLSFSPRNAWFLVTIAFTTIVLFILVGGTLWIMFDLNRRMLL